MIDVGGGCMQRYFYIVAVLLIALTGCGGGGSGGAQSSSASSSSEQNSISMNGVVNIGGQLVVDGDTNDPNDSYIPNDGGTYDQTQKVSAPVTIGGYLGWINNQPDLDDVYKVKLLAGQQITLVVSDSSVNDFDLYLYDENGNEIANSQGVDTYEVLDAPSDGLYYVDIYAYSVYEEGDTGGIYNLMIGTGNVGVLGSAVKKMRLSDQFPMVENEVIVAEKTTLARNSGTTWESALQRAGVKFHFRKGVGGITRVQLEPTANRASRMQVKTPFTHNVSPTIKAVKALRHRSDIAYADPNYIRQAFVIPDDTYYPLQWHYSQIGLPDAWDITTGSQDVVVAVVDSGVVLDHPDLSTQLVQGYDFVSSTEFSNDGDGIDRNPNDPGDGSSAKDSSFHGTHVSGTISAASNNGKGVAGVSWKSRIMPVRVLGKGGGADYDIAQGIRYAAGLPNDSGMVPTKKADIINMSLGGPGYTQELDDAVKAAQAAGVIVVAAAGNDNEDTSEYYPASLENVITVSAVDYRSDRAPYSNYGSEVDVAAPGGDAAADANGDGYPDGILSTVGENTYKFYQGTSMAAPHVSGVIALMKSVDPALSLSDVQRLLAHNHPDTEQAITIEKGTSGKDIYYGYGLINAYGAVLAAQELVSASSNSVPVLSVLPETFAFSANKNEGMLYIHNSGSGTMVLSNIYSTRSWLSVIKTAEGEYRVRVSTSSLTDGVYNAAIVIESNGGNKTIPVLLTIDSSNVNAGDVGTVYVLLVDPITLQAVAQAKTSSPRGYRYDFSDVPSGEYFLVAGTDMNNDGYVDNNGEAKGIYPVLSQPKIITLDHDMSGVDLSASYQTVLQTASVETADENAKRAARTVYKRKEW